MSRVDSQTVSLHYVTSYADGDRIDFSSYEDNPLFKIQRLFCQIFRQFYHRQKILMQSLEILIHLVARILISYTPYSFPALE